MHLHITRDFLRMLAERFAATRCPQVAGSLAPKFNMAPNNQLGDTVVQNDRPFLASFPYLGVPH